MTRSERDMRQSLLAFICLVSLAMVPLSAKAFPASSDPTAAGARPYYLEIAQGCGPGFHWVGKHRNRYGAWVPGHCARN
jgi:hypothetical protein